MFDFSMLKQMMGMGMPIGANTPAPSPATPGINPNAAATGGPGFGIGAPLVTGGLGDAQMAGNPQAAMPSTFDQILGGVKQAMMMQNPMMAGMAGAGGDQNSMAALLSRYLMQQGQGQPQQMQMLQQPRPMMMQGGGLQKIGYGNV